MIQGIFLLIIGLILIYVEFFLPGGIMGTAGALIIVSAIFFFAQGADSLALVLLFTLATIALVWLTIKLALFRIRKSGSEERVFSHLCGKCGRCDHPRANCSPPGKTKADDCF